MGYEYTGGADYYVDGGEKERSIKSMMDHYYNEAYTANSAYWSQGLIDKRFKVGDQTLSSSLYGQDDFYGKKQFFFNRIRKHVNMLSGHQRRNRKSFMTEPLESDDTELSDDFTKALLYCERTSRFQESFSKSCEGAADVGVSWMHLDIDYQREPVRGELIWDNVAYNNCLVDPYFRKPDLSDCNFWWRRQWVSKDYLKTIIPERSKEINRLRASGNKDGRFSTQVEMQQQSCNDLLPLDYFYYLSTRKATIVIDRQDGHVYEMMDKDAELAPWEIKKVVEKSTVKMALVVGKKVLYDGPNSLGTDRWPIVPTLCYYEPDLPNLSYRIQGVVRNMRDAQFLYNRRKVIELDILESVANSGWIYEVDAVTDPKSFRQTSQGVLIPVKKGKDIRSSIERIQPPSIPESMIALSRSLAEDITDISGVSDELMGSATDDKAGILSMLRQGAGLTTLQPIFDTWDFAQQLCGSLMLETAQRNWTEGKVKRILNKDEVNPRFFDTELSKYEVVVKPGVYSVTQQQMEAQQLVYARNELGIPIPDKSIIRSLSIQNKDELLKDIQEERDAQQQIQQQAQQIQQMEAQSKAAVQQAKASADTALAQERQAKIVQGSADMALKLSQAEKDEAEADLALVKQLVEIDGLSMERLARSMQIAEMIRQEGNQKELPTNPWGEML